MRRLPSFKILILLTSLACIHLANSHAQDAVAPAPSEPRPLASIRALLSTIAAIEIEVDKKQAELLDETTAAGKESIGTEIRDLNKKITALKLELESIATGVDVSEFSERLGEKVAFEEELREFFRPLIKEAKRATAKPRELEELRNAVAFHSKRLDMAGEALQQLRSLIANTQNEETRRTLENMELSWTNREKEARNQLITAQYQLEDRLASEDSLWDTLSSGVANFFRTKGKNIVIALASMAATFFLLRLLHRSIERFSPFRRRGNSFGARLFDVIYLGTTTLLTIGAGLAAFYALGDWMLFGFSLLILAGLAWASKNTIPRVSEQIKLMLNLGRREEERLVFDGVPWQVKKLSLYSRLTNPALEGGELRLPLRDLIPLSSRPFGAKEPFFPCEKGHWLLLADGTFGKVIRQTPEWVQLVLLGSSVKTFTTADFIGQTPQNLSLGFRVQQVFGIDYSHQSIATSEIPSVLKERLTAGLNQLLGADKVVNVGVEFASASASSLDMAVLADFSGDAAARYNHVSRAIQRLCVETCNEFGWIIPFTQITMHQAAPHTLQA